MQADVILETVQGSFSNAPFESSTYWRITYDGSSPLTINSVTISLRAGGQNLSGVFDIGATGSSPFGPVIGSASGLTAGDVTFSPNTGTGFHQLTLSFTPGAFSAGDFVYFGADYDFLDFSDIDGDVPGQTSVGASVTYSNSAVVSGFMADVDADGSGGVDDGISRVTLSTPAVPEPGTVALVGLGLATVLLRRRRARM
jgi:hypothetical protein